MLVALSSSYVVYFFKTDAGLTVYSIIAVSSHKIPDKQMSGDGMQLVLVPIIVNKYFFDSTLSITLMRFGIISYYHAE